MNRLLLLLTLLSTSCISNTQKERAYAKTQLGTAYIKEQSPEAAIEVLREATDLDPRSWDAWNKLALAYQARGAFDLAEKSFKRSLRVAPDNGEVNNNYGALLIHLNRLDEAISVLEVAEADLTYRNPSLALNNLGYALYLSGQYESAVTRLNEAVRRAPNLCQARFHRGLALQAMGEMEASLDDYETVIHLCGDEAPGAYYHAASVLVDQGEDEAARHYLQTVLTQAPGTAMARAADSLMIQEGL